MGLRSVVASAVGGRLDRTDELLSTATTITAAADTAAGAGVPEPTPRPGGPWPDPITRAIAEAQASIWLGAVAESIPAVRRAVRLIAGTVGAWRLTAWKDGRRLPDSAIPWLAQPDPGRTSQAILSPTLHDGIWHDRSVWRAVPGGYRRIRPERITEVPGSDVDDPPTVLVDGEVGADPLVVFRFGGAGGLRALSVPLVALMGDVFAAAARYAHAPGPEIILKNTGIDIGNPDVDDLIARWDASRAASMTGYLGAYLDAIQVGYSARDLQLIEAMDELAKEAARLFGLPAAALGVSAGDSLTYSTTVEQRRDVLEALRPWRAGVEQTLSMGVYAVTITATGVSATRAGAYVPWGTDVRLDTADFDREAWPTRMTTLGTAIKDGLITPEEARDMEPTITAVTLPGTPAPSAPAAAASTPAAAGPDPAAPTPEDS